MSTKQMSLYGLKLRYKLPFEANCHQCETAITVLQLLLLLFLGNGLLYKQSQPSLSQLWVQAAESYAR